MKAQRQAAPITPMPPPWECNLDDAGHDSRPVNIVNGGSFQAERQALREAIDAAHGGPNFVMHLVNHRNGGITVQGWGLTLGYVDPNQARVLHSRIDAVGGWYACWGKVYFSKTYGGWMIEAELPKGKP